MHAGTVMEDSSALVSYEVQKDDLGKEEILILSSESKTQHETKMVVETSTDKEKEKPFKLWLPILHGKFNKRKKK